MRVQLLDPTKGYKPVTDRAEASGYLQSAIGRKEVALRILPTSERGTLSTVVTNSDALVGEYLHTVQIGISSPASKGHAWFAVNEY